MKRAIAASGACSAVVYVLGSLSGAGCTTTNDTGDAASGGGADASLDGASSGDGPSGSASDGDAGAEGASGGDSGAETSGGGTPGCTPPGCQVNACPDPLACGAAQFCCLRRYAGGTLQGDCESQNACADGGGAFVQCKAQIDCGQNICCTAPSAGGGVTGSTCVVSCSFEGGVQEICQTGPGDDGGIVGAPDDCATIGGARTNDCRPTTGTPFAIFGVCVRKADAGP